MLAATAKNRTKSCSNEKSGGIGKSRSGFTLIEVMLAVSILAMVIAVVSTSFRIGINAWEKGESKIKSLQTNSN